MLGRALRALALLILVALWAPAAKAQIALVNTANGGDTSGSTFASIASSAINVSAGNLLVVFCDSDTTSSQTITVTDTGSANTFIAINTSTADSTHLSAMFYAKNAAAVAGDVITCNFSTNSSFPTVLVVQYSGVDKTSPLDATATGTAFGTTVTSGAFSTGSANEVIVAGASFENINNVFTPGSGYTQEVAGGSNASAIEDKIVSAVQNNVTASMTSTLSANMMITVATFKAATVVLMPQLLSLSGIGGGGGGPQSGGGALPCFYYVASAGGDDTKDGRTPATAFATLTHAQTQMQGNSLPLQKVTCLLAGSKGSYNLTASLSAGAADNDETWQYDPASGVNTALIDGGATLSAVLFSGVARWTWNGIRVTNCGLTCFTTPGDALNTSITIKNSEIDHSNGSPGGALSGGLININNCKNCTFSRDYLHDSVGPGISLGAFNQGDTLAGTLVDRIVVINACQVLNDCGAIYFDERSAYQNGASAGSKTISNSFIRDYGTASVQAEGIYLDDDGSNATITGNIIGPPTSGAAGTFGNTIFNGGAANSVSNNLIDLGPRNSQYVSSWTEQCAPGATCSGGNLGFAWPSGNSITGNIILSKFSGSQAVGVCHSTSDAYCQAPPAAGIPWIGTISGNTYKNYGGGNTNTFGTFISDASPNLADPACTGYLYQCTSLPGGFTDLSAARGAGPPGFTIPSSTNRSDPRRRPANDNNRRRRRQKWARAA